MLSLPTAAAGARVSLPGLPAPHTRPPSLVTPCPCSVQLVSLCRFVGIQPFGTDTFLRSRLRRHLVEIKVGGWGERGVCAEQGCPGMLASFLLGLPSCAQPCAPPSQCLPLPPQEDDGDIAEEGLDSLSEDELRQACRARGMRAPFGEGAAEFMRCQLAEWIDWSLNKCVA